MNNNSAVLILDLDGVFMGTIGFHSRNTYDLIECLQELEKWQKKGGKILVTTNRTPSEMQPIAYFLNIASGYWITENGGSLYDVSTGLVSFPESMMVYAKTYVPSLQKHLKKLPSITLHPISGQIRSIIATPGDCNKSEYIQKILEPHLLKFEYSSQFSIVQGKMISIEPKNLNKIISLNNFLKSNKITQANSLFFVADADRDIPMAHALTPYKTTIGAVGNASHKFLQFVKQYPLGICAPSTTSYHSSLAFLIRSFNSSVDKMG